CPYNVVAPKKPRVGCIIATPAAEAEHALSVLAATCPKDQEALAAILERSRSRGDEEGLSREDLLAVHALASRWWKRVSSDRAERQVAAIVLRFAELGVDLGEPVRILA